MKIARDHKETREDEAKRLNPSYRSYFNGNPSQVIFRLKVSRLLGIIETLSIDNVGRHGRSPEVIFHLSSDVAMDTPSVLEAASRQQRRIA